MNAIYGLTSYEKNRLIEKLREFGAMAIGWEKNPVDIPDCSKDIIDYVNQIAKEAFNEGVKKGARDKINDSDVIGMFANLVAERVQCQGNATGSDCQIARKHILVGDDEHRNSLNHL